MFWFRKPTKIDASDSLDCSNAKRGIPIQCQRELNNRRWQSRILQATEKLNRMQYTIAEFLEIVASEFDPVVIVEDFIKEN